MKIGDRVRIVKLNSDPEVTILGAMDLPIAEIGNEGTITSGPEEDTLCWNVTLDRDDFAGTEVGFDEDELEVII